MNMNLTPFVRMLGRHPIRMVGWLVVAGLPACAFCIEYSIHPAAIDHNSFCAQYVADGKLLEAESRCKLALEYSPKYAEPYNQLGLIEYARKNYDHAISLFKRAISYKNDFAEAHSNLGVIFMDRQDYGYACEQFKQAIEIDPGMVNARANYGLCLIRDKQIDNARYEYLKCIELDPSACDCREGLGVIEMMQSDYETAKSHFQKLTEICPDYAEGHYNLCWTYIKLERCADAVDSCIAALAIKENYIEARHNLNKGYECLALQEGTMRQYFKEIRKSPGDAGPHFKLGTLLVQKRIYDRAIKEFSNAIKLDPQHKMAHYRLAQTFDHMLRTKETINACKAFVALLSEDEYIQEKAWCVGRVHKLLYE